jgi:hypothetical protein
MGRGSLVGAKARQPPSTGHCLVNTLWMGDLLMILHGQLNLTSSTNAGRGVAGRTRAGKLRHGRLNCLGFGEFWPALCSVVWPLKEATHG